MDFKDFPWTHYNVKFAILFGSWVTGKVIKGDSLFQKLASRE
jgi:predicted nucleotidyltransferase